MTITKSTEPKKPINVNEFEALTAKFEAAKGTPEYDVLKAHFTGPDNGVYYVEETGELKIHTDWHVDQNGDIVKNN